MQSQGLKRAVRGALAAIAVAAMFALVPPSASASPELPDTASEAAQQLEALNHEAEVLTERWHAAKDQLNQRRAELDQARADQQAAVVSGQQARQVQDQFRGHVDDLASASFQGARLNRLSALLVSDSPRELVEQMAALDALAVDNNETLAQFAGAVRQAQEAEDAARAAAERATRAERDAARIEAELGAARQDMLDQVAEVEAHLAELNSSDMEDYLSEGLTDFGAVAGSGLASDAANHALSRQGAPYEWGAEGPDSFDCSGLVLWSFEQVGVSMPRSSSEQAQVGVSVSQSQLQPGDLIALYDPVSHIGIYVGDGQYVNAPQSGDVVKVSDVPWGDVTAMRRVG